MRKSSPAAWSFLIYFSIVSCRIGPVDLRYKSNDLASPIRTPDTSIHQLRFQHIPISPPLLRLSGGKKRIRSHALSSSFKSVKRRKESSRSANGKGNCLQSAPLIVALIPITASADASAAQNSLLTACSSHTDGVSESAGNFERSFGGGGFEITAQHRTVHLPPHCTGGNTARVTFIAVSGADPNELLDAAKVCAPQQLTLKHDNDP